MTLPPPPPSEGTPQDPAEGTPELMSAEAFEVAVGEALDSVPPALMEMLDNVVFFIEEEPPADEPELLGVYDGTPLTDREDGFGGHLPDRITVFRGPLTRMCADREELLEEIAVTVVHEIAHHFGIEEQRLHDLGWG